MLWNFGNVERPHRRWLLGTLAATAVFVLLYLIAWIRGGVVPTGGTTIGLTYGFLAGGIFVFEFLLWPRRSRWFRTARWLGNAQTWMHLHLWLGLLTLPLVLMHCGFSVGGRYTQWFLLIYGMVMGSGLLGLLLQNYLPRLLLDVVAGETVASQLEFVAQQLVDDAYRIAAIYLVDEHFRAAPPSDRAQNVIQVGAIRRTGTALPVLLHPGRDLAPPLRSPEISAAIRDDIVPYLTKGPAANSKFRSQRRCHQYFSELRRKTQPALADAVSALTQLCDRRRQFDLQARLQKWLNGWLLVHLPLSVGLLVLLVGHLFLALRWG